MAKLRSTLSGGRLKTSRSLAHRIQDDVILKIAPESQDEIEAGCLMTSTARAAALLSRAIEEHRIALVAEAPTALEQPLYGDVVRQDEIEPGSLVTATPGQLPF